jgi:uncharacterized protein with PhoU and TrkA domain
MERAAQAAQDLARIVAQDGYELHGVQQLLMREPDGGDDARVGLRSGPW